MPPRTLRQLVALARTAIGCTSLRTYAGVQLQYSIEQPITTYSEDDAYGITTYRWLETEHYAGRESSAGRALDGSYADQGVYARRHVPIGANKYWYRLCSLPGASAGYPAFSVPRRTRESRNVYDVISGPLETLWFDARTHLLARYKIEHDRFDYADYRRVHGIAFAYRYTEERQFYPGSAAIDGLDAIARATLTKVELLPVLPAGFAAVPSSDAR